MDPSGFFLSFAGKFAAQSFLHSLVGGAVAEIAVKAWGIRRPLARQRFFLAAIVFPAFSALLYQLAGRRRESLHFRLDALFDSGRWLSLELPGGITVGAALVVLFLFTTLVFVLQELVPVLRQGFSGEHGEDGARDGRGDPRIARALSALPVDPPEIRVIEDAEPFIFSSTGRRAAVSLSTGLLDALREGELAAALAHEIAHVIRGRRPYLAWVFFLRVLLFFNPVTLLAFRRAVQEEERICDEMAIAFTKDAASLARTLQILYLEGEDPAPRRRRGLAEAAGELERFSHRLNIESRIARLGGRYAQAAGEEWFAFALTLAAMAAVSWFVV